MSTDIGREKVLTDEARRLTFRISLAEDLGAAVLGIDNPYESDASQIRFRLRLNREQPDLARQLNNLDGRLFSVLVDRVVSGHLTD